MDYKRGLWLLTILGFIFISPLTSAWGNNDWSREVFVDINETISGSYTRMFEIPYDGDMRFDYGDLRAVNGNRTRTLPYWIEDYNSEKAWVYVNFTGDFYFYYGNPDVATTSSTDRVFSFFDHFEGSSLSGDWITCGEQYGTIYSTISNSMLTMPGGDTCCTDRCTKTFSTWGANHSFIMKGKFNSNNGQQEHIGFSDASYIWSTGTSSSHFYTYYEGGIQAYQYGDGGSNVTIISTDWDVWYKYEASVFDDRTMFYMNNTLKLEQLLKTGDNNDAKSVFIASNTGGPQFDWVAMRIVTYPEPNYNIGAEETLQPSYENATFSNVNIINNLIVGKDISGLRSFFNYLGSFISRIIKGWFIEIDAVNITTQNLKVNNKSVCLEDGTNCPEDIEIKSGIESIKEDSCVTINFITDFSSGPVFVVGNVKNVGKNNIVSIGSTSTSEFDLCLDKFGKRSILDVSWIATNAGNS